MSAPDKGTIAAIAVHEQVVGAGKGQRVRAWLRDRVGVGALVVVALIVIAALFPGVLTPYNPLQPDPLEILQGPSAQHLLGTDELGRDLLSRIIWGTRASLLLALIVVALSAGIGLAVGLIAGTAGGFTDTALMRLSDVFLAFPDLILAMAFAAALGPSLVNAGIALGLAWWPTYARLVRGEVLVARETAYVEAARAVGLGTVRVATRHILPNVIDVVLVRVTMTAGFAILAGAGLSFIGLGAQPPTPEWGLLVAEGRNYVLTGWWYPTFTGAAIVIAVMALTVAGDTIQKMLVRE